MNLTPKQVAVLSRLNKKFGPIVTRAQVMEEFANARRGELPRWIFSEEFRITHGKFSTLGVPASAPADTPAPVVVDEPMTVENVMVMPQQKRILNKQGSVDLVNLVPKKYGNFVAFGDYEDIKAVIQSRQFFPVFITGLSGNGKSLSVQQACAELGREYIRVQITPETDEDDLLGGYRLIDGETVWFDGPVTIAAIRGAVLLLDEIDYGTGKISCLQNVLEGKGIYLKKVNRFVDISPGFTVIATANTKGRGAEEYGGKYVNTNIMNEAFLERFKVTYEQEFPPVQIEKKILIKQLKSNGCDPDDTFAENLAKWADVIRRTYFEDGIDDVISTRRLVHIVDAYSIFRNKVKAIQRCVARFDKETQAQFLELWSKIEAPAVTPAPEVPVKVDGDEIPF